MNEGFPDLAKLREEEMGRREPPTTFERQALNFGKTYEVVKRAVRDSSVEPTGNSESAPICGNSMNFLMEKPKKKKRKQLYIPDSNDCFVAYATSVIGDDAEVQHQLRLAQEEMAKTSFPLLRFALHANTKIAILAAFFKVFKHEFPQSISKPELITRSVNFLKDFFHGNTSSIVGKVGDFGVVQTDDAMLQLAKGTLVLLKVSDPDNLGNESVVPSNRMQGWVFQNNALKFVEVAEDNLVWGELYKRQKNFTTKL